jgi:hypothetical protein
MDLREIASVSGKSGLYRVLQPTRTGVILEALDGNNTKLVANANSKVSILKEISIYSTGATQNVALEVVLANIHAKFGATINVNGKSDNAALIAFLGDVLPDFDRERVYVSDIKKLVVWYEILVKFAPSIFEKKAEAAATEGEEVKKVAAPKAAKDASATKKASTTKIKSSQNTGAKNVSKTTLPSKRGA